MFAAEATARLTRTTGLAVVTAGPGVTNSVSAITTAHFNGAPVVALGGRAPDYRWGAGSLQEIDQPPILAPVTKRAWTEHTTAQLAGSVDEAFRLAAAPHRGPVFLDVPLEALYDKAEARLPAAAAPLRTGRTRPPSARSPGCWPRRSGRCWCSVGRLDGRGGAAARATAEQLQLPVIANGQGRGIVPAGHPLLVTRARAAAFREADLVLVAGAPLDFRLGYGQFGAAGHAAQVVHIADSPGQLATHSPLAGSAAGDLAAFFTGLGPGSTGPPPWMGPSRAPRRETGPPAPGRTGWPGCRTRAGPRSPRTRNCSPATPGSSTPCVSTAS